MGHHDHQLLDFDPDGITAYTITCFQYLLPIFIQWKEAMITGLHKTGENMADAINNFMLFSLRQHHCIHYKMIQV